MRALFLFLFAPLFVFAGCGPECDLESDCTLEPVLHTFDVWGTAPWDPLEMEVAEGAVSWSQDGCNCESLYESTWEAIPTVHDAAGTAVSMERMDVPTDHDHPWVAEDDYEPGEYTLVGIEGTDYGWNESFTVEAYGYDEAFTPADVEGRVYRLDPDSVRGSIMDAIMGILADDNLYFLEVGEVDGEQVEVRLVWELDDGSDDPAVCEMVSGQGTLSETGELWWTIDEVDLTTEPTIPAQDLLLHLGWQAGGEQAGGVHAEMVVDTYDVSVTLSDDDDPYNVCQMIAGLGGEDCYPCGDQEEPTCTTLALYAATAEVAESSFEEDLDACGLMFSEDGLSSCSTGVRPRSGGLALALLVLLGLAGRRRAPRRP